MNWTVLVDICLGACALSVARDARKATEKLTEVLSKLSGRVDNHEERLNALDRED